MTRDPESDTHDRTGPVIMERLVRLEDADREFDIEFWRRVGSEGRLSALGDLLRNALLLKGEDGDPPRLQRSVERVERR